MGSQQRRTQNAMHFPRRIPPATVLLLCVICTSWQAQQGEALQFFLEARTKRCFKEDIPLSTDAVFSYTIAQGTGAMPVAVRVMDINGKRIHERDEADHGVFTIRAPDDKPAVKEHGNWALRDEDKEEEAFFRNNPDALDNRVPYVFCFEHVGSYMPRLSRGESGTKRRVLFEVKFGAGSHDQGFYDKLAKEKHLSSTEELFRVVEDRVTDIVRLIDEMRQRDMRMAIISARTSRSVAWYSILACAVIAAGAAFASYSSLKFLRVEKRLR